MGRPTPLARFLFENGLRQTEVAAGAGRTPQFVSMLVRGETGASLETVEALIAFLSKRLGRRVAYEEVFGPSEEATA